MDPLMIMSDGDELLCGAKEISRFIGRSIDTTKRMLETGRLPAFKCGERWHMRKGAYRSWSDGLLPTPAT